MLPDRGSWGTTSDVRVLNCSSMLRGLDVYRKGEMADKLATNEVDWWVGVLVGW